MSYAGSEAVSLAYAERSQAYEQPMLRPALEVVNGAGLDARVRQGVSDDFLSKVTLAIAIVVTVVILGACRVGLCAMTLTTLQSTSAMRAEIKAAQALETDLKVTRSVLADTSRIDRIATENYGMVKVTEYETVSIPLVGTAAEPVEEAEPAEEPADGALVIENPVELLFGAAEVEEPEEEERMYTTMAMPVEEEAEAGAAEGPDEGPAAQADAGDQA